MMANRQIKVSMATAQDIVKIIAMYVEYFERTNTGETPLLDDDIDLDMMLLNDDMADLGVDLRKRLNVAELEKLLGFENSRPLNWCKYRHQDPARSSWNEADQLLYVEGREGLVELKLLWHQLAGVASIIDKWWKVEKTSQRPPGVLLADAVGVGKTAQVMATIAFLQHAWMAQEHKSSMPPIIGKS